MNGGRENAQRRIGSETQTVGCHAKSERGASTGHDSSANFLDPLAWSTIRANHRTEKSDAHEQDPHSPCNRHDLPNPPLEATARVGSCLSDTAFGNREVPR